MPKRKSGQLEKGMPKAGHAPHFTVVLNRLHHLLKTSELWRRRSNKARLDLSTDQHQNMMLGGFNLACRQVAMYSCLHEN